jgi:hypothetical protein
LIRRGKALFAEKRGLATSQACSIWRWRRCCDRDPPASRSRLAPLVHQRDGCESGQCRFLTPGSSS